MKICLHSFCPLICQSWSFFVSDLYITITLPTLGFAGLRFLGDFYLALIVSVSTIPASSFNDPPLMFLDH